MKTIIVICDNRRQYDNYMRDIIDKLSSGTTIKNSIDIYTIAKDKYIPLCHKEDIRKIMRFNRENIEIRAIGSKAMNAYLNLRGQSWAFGLVA